MKQFKEFIEEQQDVLRSSFAKVAERAGWPEDLVSQITIKVEDGNIIMDIPSEVKTKVDELEFGDIGKPPTYVMRKFEKIKENAVSEAAMKSIIYMISPGSEEDFEFSAS